MHCNMLFILMSPPPLLAQKTTTDIFSLAYGILRRLKI